MCCGPWGHRELDTTERLNWGSLCCETPYSHSINLYTALVLVLHHLHLKSKAMIQTPRKCYWSYPSTGTTHGWFHIGVEKSVRWSGSSMLIWIPGSWWWSNKIGHWKEGMETEWRLEQVTHTELMLSPPQPTNFQSIYRFIKAQLKILSLHKPTLNIAVKSQFFSSCNCNLCQLRQHITLVYVFLSQHLNKPVNSVSTSCCFCTMLSF